MLDLSHHFCMTDPATPPRQILSVDREAFRDRLVYIRKKTGMSAQDFGASIGLPKGNYSQVEKGKRLLTVDQIYNVYVRYGVPMEYLIAGQETNLPARFRD